MSQTRLVPTIFGTGFERIPLEPPPAPKSNRVRRPRPTHIQQIPFDLNLNDDDWVKVDVEEKIGNIQVFPRIQTK